MMNLMSRIERLVRNGGATESQVGREAIGDPCFVRDLRNGRQPRPETQARLTAWLDAAERTLKEERCAR
jgi:2,4-dienoyl-CoA reductase-like NADH-dependent reductase (Old Yellow Enzyme family)